MPDFAFDVVGVRRAARWHAARAAVLWECLGPRVGEYGVEENLAKLRKRWHYRLFQLADAGLDVSKGRLQYMRNCPPFGVTTDTKAWCCNRPFICPFCWARRCVIAPLIDLERILWGSTNPKAKPLHPRCRLVRVQTRYFVRPHHGLPRVGRQRAACLVLVRDIIKNHRDVERKTWAALAGFVVHKISQLPRGYAVYRSGLLLLRDGLQAETLPDPDFRGYHPQCVVEDVLQTRAAVAKAAGQSCRAPRGFLDADPEETVRLMRDLRDVRMIGTFGKLKTTFEDGDGTYLSGGLLHRTGDTPADGEAVEGVGVCDPAASQR